MQVYIQSLESTNHDRLQVQFSLQVILVGNLFFLVFFLAEALPAAEALSTLCLGLLGGMLEMRHSKGFPMGKHGDDFSFGMGWLCSRYLTCSIYIYIYTHKKADMIAGLQQQMYNMQFSCCKGTSQELQFLLRRL